MLQAGGYRVPAMSTFNEEVEEKVARIAPQSILEATVDNPDGCFFPARTCAVPALSQDGKPVFSSNQVGKC